MAKKTRLLDKAKDLEEAPKGVDGWIKNQSKEVQQELCELKQAYQTGDVTCSMAALIRLLKQETGIPHGETGIRSWLRRSD
jgi:hypothetical protein